MLRKRRISMILVVLMLSSLCGCKREIPLEEDTVLTDAGDATKKPDTNDLENGASTKIGVENEVVELVPEEGAQLVFWTGDSEFGEVVAQNFEAEFGVPVTVEQVGKGAMDKIALSGPAGTGADVFMSQHDLFQHGVASGLLLELDESIVLRMKERIKEVGIQTVTSGGKLYGVPVSLETTCLFYNKDLIGDEPATTLEEIMDNAVDFNDPKNNRFYFLTAIDDGYKIFPFLSVDGFSLFGEDGTDDNNPGFDTDEFEKGLELVSSLHSVIPISSIDLGNESFLKSQFIEGKVAYEISGPWDITEFKESGVNFGVTVLPSYNSNSMTPFAGVQNAHVSAFTEYPIAAQLFAEYLVSDETAGLMYTMIDKITTLKDVSNIEGLSEDEYIKPFVEQFANSCPMPSASRISYFWTISAAVCQSVFDGQLTPGEGRQKALDDWNTLLATE